MTSAAKHFDPFFSALSNLTANFDSRCSEIFPAACSKANCSVCYSQIPVGGNSEAISSPKSGLTS